MTKPTQSLSYKDAGVDIDAGNALIDKIKGAAKRTRRPEVMAGLGGFGAPEGVHVHHGNMQYEIWTESIRPQTGR